MYKLKLNKYRVFKVSFLCHRKQNERFYNKMQKIQRSCVARIQGVEGGVPPQHNSFLRINNSKKPRYKHEVAFCFLIF